MRSFEFSTGIRTIAAGDFARYWVWAGQDGPIRDMEPEIMGIRTSLGGLGSIFGVGETSAVSTPARTSAPASSPSMSEDMATLSGMGSAMAMSGSGVRPGKVAGIQAAMARGGYSVPSSAVAGKIVDFMLGTTA